MFQATFIMSGRVFILSIWMCLFLMIPGRCEENLQLFVDRLEILEDNYDNLKSDLVSYEQRTKRRIYRAKTSVRNEIKNTMKKQIKDTVLDILRSDSVTDMITSLVISETRHMKRVNQQMRRELHQLRSFLVHVQSDNMMYKKSFEELEIKNNEMCFKCLESNTLTSKFAEIHDNITKLDEKIINLDNLQHQHKEDSFQRSSEVFVFHGPVTASSSVVSTSPSTTTSSSSTNSTSTSMQHKYIGDTLKTSNEQELLTAPKSVVTPSPSSLTYTSTTSAISTLISPTPTTSLTTRKTSTSTTAASTAPSTPQGERNRILVFQYDSSAAIKVKQIDIKSQAVTIFPNLKLKEVFDAVYVSKLNSLLIAQFVPKRILSYNMDSSSTDTLRDDLVVRSIAVDEGRDFVFLARDQPARSICRMDLLGEHLTVLFNTSSVPYVVVVNPQTRHIYVSTRGKLFSMTYNADNVHTVATGLFYSYIYAALDVSKGYLYYNSFESLYRHTISENTTTRITQLGFLPLGLRYYSDTIYVSWLGQGPVEAFDLKTNMLHNLTVRSSFYYGVICLVP